MTRIVIIGGGPAGYEAALVAAQQGRRGLLDRSDGIGGACVLFDCVPSKTFIASTGIRTDMRRATDLGISLDPSSATISLPEINPGQEPRAGAVLRHPRAPAERRRAAALRKAELIDRQIGMRPTRSARPSPPARRRSSTRTSCSSRPARAPACCPVRCRTASASSRGVTCTTSRSCRRTGGRRFRCHGRRVRFRVHRDGLSRSLSCRAVTASCRTRTPTPLWSSRRARRARREPWSSTPAPTPSNGRGRRDRRQAVGRSYRARQSRADGGGLDAQHRGAGPREGRHRTRQGGYLRVDRVSRTAVSGIYAAGDCTGLLPLASVAAMQGRIAMYHAWRGREPDQAQDGGLRSLHPSRDRERRRQPGRDRQRRGARAHRHAAAQHESAARCPVCAAVS